VRVAPEELLHGALYGGHAGHPADQHDLADLRRCELGVPEHGAAGIDRALDELGRDDFELAPLESTLEVQRAGE